MKESADLLVRGQILTMNATRTLITDGAVAVYNGRIAGVGPRSEMIDRFECRAVIGDDHAIVMPGFIDAHTHCTQCFVRSLTGGELPMIPRLYNPAQRSLDAEQAAVCVRLISAQLLRAGITTMCEGTLNPEHENAIVEAIEEVGIRCCLARGAADQDFHHASLYTQIRDKSSLHVREGEADVDLARTTVFLDRYPARSAGLIRGGVNASSLLGFSERYFVEGAKLARERDATFQVHVARDREEVEFCLSVFGKRPIERLAELGVINEHLVAVHAVLASEREIELLASGGAALAHSPIECVANLNAIPNVPRFRASGIRVALGCDNQANDMFATMRAAWLIHGAKWGLPAYEPEFLSSTEILGMATIEAAKVLRMDDITGSLELGKSADIVVLDGSGPHMMAMQHLPTELLRYGSRAEVRATIVAGRVLYQDGHFSSIDIDKLRLDSRLGATHVRAALEGRRYRALSNS
jgi:5-methylthioadenosine/S-adenosylhomocysteine deaminase